MKRIKDICKWVLDLSQLLTINPGINTVKSMMNMKLKKKKQKQLVNLSSHGSNLNLQWKMKAEEAVPSL